jgi:hypothetical protein
LGECKGSRCLDGRQHFVHILVYHEIIICYQCPESGHVLLPVGMVPETGVIYRLLVELDFLLFEGEHARSMVVLVEPVCMEV